LVAQPSKPLTIYLNTIPKLLIRDLANAQGVSMSALVREWIDERLDLPVLETS